METGSNCQSPGQTLSRLYEMKPERFRISFDLCLRGSSIVRQRIFPRKFSARNQRKNPMVANRGTAATPSRMRRTHVSRAPRVKRLSFHGTTTIKGLFSTRAFTRIVVSYAACASYRRRRSRTGRHGALRCHVVVLSLFSTVSLSGKRVTLRETRRQNKIFS